MHQNMPFQGTKFKNFLGRGRLRENVNHLPPLRLLPRKGDENGEGETLFPRSTPLGVPLVGYGASILVPSTLVLRHSSPVQKS